MAQAYVYEDDATGWRHIAAGDLNNSGVTAATYGDGSHVGQFTVGVDGIITAASNVAISGGAAGTWTQIFASILNADAANIDTGVNGIPNSYTHLAVFIMAKSDSASTVFPFFVRGVFNGSGGTAYESSAFGANVNTLSATTNNGIMGLMTDLGTGQSTTSFAPSVIYIPQYKSTTISKSWTGTSHQIGRADAANNFTAIIAGLWDNTAAINQLLIAPSIGTNFKAGSSMHIYGIT